MAQAVLGRAARLASSVSVHRAGFEHQHGYLHGGDAVVQRRVCSFTLARSSLWSLSAASSDGPWHPCTLFTKRRAVLGRTSSLKGRTEILCRRGSLINFGRTREASFTPAAAGRGPRVRGGSFLQEVLEVPFGGGGAEPLGDQPRVQHQCPQRRDQLEAGSWGAALSALKVPETRITHTRT